MGTRNYSGNSETTTGNSFVNKVFWKRIIKNDSNGIPIPNYRYRACFEQEVSGQSGNYRV